LRDSTVSIISNNPGEDLEVVWAEFSTLKMAVLFQLNYLQTATSGVENLGPGFVQVAKEFVRGWPMRENYLYHKSQACQSA
jgi:hypothetical protein